MKPLFFITCAFIMASAISQATASIQESFPWHKSIEEAQTASNQSQKPIMLYFTTDWCGWCKIMEKEAFSEKQCIAQASLYHPVKIDAEKEGAALAKKYQIEAFPTFVFLKPNGEVIATIAGYRKPDEWLERISQLFISPSELDRINETLKQNPNEPQANAELALRLIGEGKIDEAQSKLAIARAAKHKSPEFARALSNLGQIVARINLAEGIGLLEESLAQNDQSSTSVTFERMIMANLYANKSDDNIPIYPRVLASEFTSPELKEKVARSIKSIEYTPQLATPEQVIAALIKQLQANPNRDPYYFTALFYPETPISMPLERGNQTSLLYTSVPDLIRALGIDDFKTKLEVRKQEIHPERNIAAARLEVSLTQTLRDNSTPTTPYVLNLHLVKNGPRWYISSFHMEPIK